MGVCLKKSIGDLVTLLSSCRKSWCEANTPPSRTAAVQANLPRAVREKKLLLLDLNKPTLEFSFATL